MTTPTELSSYSIMLTSLFPFPLPFSVSLIFNPNSNDPPDESSPPTTESTTNSNGNDIILSISKSLILTSSFVAIILARLIRLVINREYGPEDTYLGYRYRRRRARRIRRGRRRRELAVLRRDEGVTGPVINVA
ncbi:hypothetical protein FQN54_008856 [Arachnomyces sp. PD_36]|nr:hypothetical protein FQN54_008856 [Arachnomyces sp. PD_36]